MTNKKNKLFLFEAIELRAELDAKLKTLKDKGYEQFLIQEKLMTGVKTAESEKMMEGKIRAKKRALRRHHVERKKVRVP